MQLYANVHYVTIFANRNIKFNGTLFLFIYFILLQYRAILKFITVIISRSSLIALTSTAVFILREMLLAFTTSIFLLRQNQKFRERTYLSPRGELLDSKVK